MPTLGVIDLFAGAGGLSLGAARAGLDVRLLLDVDPVSCATLRVNQKRLGRGTVLEEDVTLLSGRDLRTEAGIGWSDPLLVVGGAPCQPFSKAAYWLDPGGEARYRRARARGQRAQRPRTPPRTRPDDRRSLVGEFWRCVSEARADAFLFENVPSILHPRNRHLIERLMRSARGAGFRTCLVRANAADFGIAQKRERVFLLAVRGARPSPPTPTHSKEPSLDGTASPYVTAGKVIAPYSDAEFFEPEEVIEGRWAQHLREVPPGWNYKAHTSWGGHPRPTFETETRFWNFLLKLHPDLPSWTIPANPGPWTGPFHWNDRRLRILELAALQGFPDGYQFAGNRRERVRQIGNAVPPALAEVMIRAIVAALVGLNGSSDARRRQAVAVR